MADAEIYRDQIISVTPTLVKINSSTYAVANIGSVYVTQQNIGGLVAGAIVFGLLTLGGIKSGGSGVTVVCGAIAGICVYGAIKRKYYLTFRTASADQKALSSTDKGYLFTLQGAIEKAITQRG